MFLNAIASVMRKSKFFPSTTIIPFTLIVDSCPKKEIFPVASTLSGVIFTAISEILSTSFANN